MNDIDPAKMTDAERIAFFRSFTKDLPPTTPTRRAQADQIAPWIAAIRADRERGLDWKQLAKVCTDDLKIKISASSLQRIMLQAKRASAGHKRSIKRATKPVTTAAAPKSGNAAPAVSNPPAPLADGSPTKN